MKTHNEIEEGFVRWQIQYLIDTHATSVLINSKIQELKRLQKLLYYMDNDIIKRILDKHMITIEECNQQIQEFNDDLIEFKHNGEVVNAIHQLIKYTISIKRQLVVKKILKDNE